MSTTLALHRNHTVGLGSLRMFQVGIRDGIDLPDAGALAIAGRAFALGVSLGRHLAHTAR